MNWNRTRIWIATAMMVMHGAVIPAVAQKLLHVEIEFLRVAPGTFTMGCSPNDDECADNEKPAHTVRITTEFELGKYEITQAQWQSVTGSNPSKFKDAGSPVGSVSWNDVQEFIQKLNARNDGYHYRLPTEAEWEYAARAGSMDPYVGRLGAIAWYDKNSGNSPHTVGDLTPNAWGFCDMLGNAGEWVNDWYAADYYNGGARTDPNGPPSGQSRVLRGGSWDDLARDIRVSNRFTSAPDNRYVNVGFRLLRERL